MVNNNHIKKKHQKWKQKKKIVNLYDLAKKTQTKQKKKQKNEKKKYLI